MEEIKKLLEIAEEVAREAGSILKARQHEEQKINFQDDTDVKLQADVDSEKLIREKLTAGTGFPIIGEEEGGDLTLLNRDEMYWVVDPLDGTYNYLRNQPQVCISIGLMQGKEFVAGVIYDFIRNELYSGALGVGIYINGEKITPKWELERGRACLMTGFPSSFDFSSGSLERYIDQIQQFKKVRMIGCAAIAVATVAAGRADAYYEESTRLWDIAAGAALVRAAGGTVIFSPKEDNPPTCDLWAVANEDWLSK